MIAHGRGRATVTWVAVSSVAWLAGWSAYVGLAVLTALLVTLVAGPVFGRVEWLVAREALHLSLWAAIVGYSQSLVMRRWGYQPRFWTLASIAGVVTGWLVVALARLPFGALTGSPRELPAAVLSMSIVFALGPAVAQATFMGLTWRSLSYVLSRVAGTAVSFSSVYLVSSFAYSQDMGFFTVDAAGLLPRAVMVLAFALIAESISGEVLRRWLPGLCPAAWNGSSQERLST